MGKEEFIVYSFDFVYVVNFQPGEKRNIYYCGITNDLDRRKTEHKIKDFLITIKCDSFACAKNVEEKLSELGFDTGSETGHGTDDSRYVYMYKKTSETNP